MMATKEPTPVLIAPEQTPIPVVNADPPAPTVTSNLSPSTVISGQGTTLTPTTTEAQDKTTAGQRRINLIWEGVQGFIAVAVTSVTVFVLGRMSLQTAEVTSNQLIAVSQLVVMATLILSFYFSRTNHAAIGGTGTKPESPYEGR